MPKVEIPFLKRFSSGLTTISDVDSHIRKTLSSLTRNINLAVHEIGDIAEVNAVLDVFGEHSYNLNINSTKSMTGHLLGAAGAIEAITSILAINNSIVPPTINHSVYDENIDSKINFTFGKAQKRNVDIALSNTFGFGGHNACVVFSKLD